MVEVAEPEGGAAEVFESYFDRFGGAVAGAGSGEERQDVDSALLEGASELADSCFERGTTHLLNRSAFVIDLHGRQPVGEIRDLLDLGQRRFGQEPGSDAAGVRLCQCCPPFAVKPFHEVVKSMRIADLLNGKDIRSEICDRRRQRIELALVLLRALGPGVISGTEKVVEIPCTDRHHAHNRDGAK